MWVSPCADVIVDKIYLHAGNDGLWVKDDVYLEYSLMAFRFISSKALFNFVTPFCSISSSTKCTAPALMHPLWTTQLPGCPKQAIAGHQNH